MATIRPSLIAVLIASAAALSAPAARASGWSASNQYAGQPCDTELNAVGYAVDAALYVGSRPASDKAALLAALSSTREKIVVRRLSDAVRTLDDLQARVDTLVVSPRPQVAEASAGPIYTALAGAARCIGSAPIAV